MKQSKICSAHLVAFILVSLCNPVFGADIARQIRSGDSVEDLRQDGGYFEVGFGIGGVSHKLFKGGEGNHLGLLGGVSAGYQWNGLFVELFQESEKRLVFGYNVLNNSNWSIDLVLGPEHRGINKEQSQLFETLRKRQADLSGGIRATGYFANDIIQFEVREELTNKHGGFTTSLLAGRSWQLRNTNTHAILGLHHSSSEVVDYYWGVNQSEASSTFNQYTAGASTGLSAEFGITYPLTENWVFRSKLKYFYHSDAVTNSPLLASDTPHRAVFSISFNYVL